jgi:hypothetical protein
MFSHPEAKYIPMCNRLFENNFLIVEDANVNLTASTSSIFVSALPVVHTVDCITRTGKKSYKKGDPRKNKARITDAEYRNITTSVAAGVSDDVLNGAVTTVTKTTKSRKKQAVVKVTDSKRKRKKCDDESESDSDAISENEDENEVDNEDDVNDGIEIDAGKLYSLLFKGVNSNRK